MKPVLLMLITAAFLSAQQPNSNEASLVVNGIDGGVYPIMAVLPVPQTVNATFGGAPGSPFLVVTGTLLQPGFSVGSAGLVDLAVPTLSIVADGFSPVTALDLLAQIPGSSTTRTLAAFPAAPQMDFAMQGLMADATTPGGVRLTAASRLRATGGSATRILFASDDDSVQYLLQGSPVNVAGNLRTQLWINSNGNVTFGGGDSTGIPTDSGMRNGPERLALNWRDLDPTAGGEVWVFEDTGAVVVDYHNVPIVNALASQDTFSGCIRFESTGAVEMEVYSGSSGEAIVGYSFGGLGGAAPSQPTDLTAVVPLSLSGQGAVFEHFIPGGVQDLIGTVIRIDVPTSSGIYAFDVVGITPAVTELFPPNGPNIGLASLVIRGRGFRLGTQVFFDSTPAQIVDHLSNEELLIRTPPGPSGLADLTISVPGETPIVLPDAYLYEPLATTNIAIPFSPGSSIELPFLHGYVFPFHSRWHDSIWLNANGTLTFDDPDASPQPTVSAFENGPPRIALSWADWQWGPSSVLAISITPYFLRIGFVNVISPVAGQTVSLSINLSHHGEIFHTFSHGFPAAETVLVGQSPGLGISSVNGAIDINAGATATMPFASSFEMFDSVNLFDLTGLDWNLVPTTPAGPAFLSQTVQSQP